MAHELLKANVSLTLEPVVPNRFDRKGTAIVCNCNFQMSLSR